MKAKIFLGNPVYVVTLGSFPKMYKLDRNKNLSFSAYIEESYVAYKELLNEPHMDFEIKDWEVVEAVVRREFPEIFL